MDDSRPAPAVTSAPAVDELRAGLFMIAGATCFAIHFAVVKFLTLSLPVPVIVLWRGIFAVLAFSPNVLSRGWRILATGRPASHGWRSLFGFSSFLLFVYAVGMLPLGDAVALTFSSPFWSVLLGIVVFHDRMTWRLALAVLVGFSGVVLIAQPSGATGLGLGAGLALGSAVIGSLAMMMVKQLSRSEPPERITFYFAFGGTIFALPLAAYDWAWPALADWPYLLVSGGLFYLGQICLTNAYARGTFSRVAPLDLTRLPVSVVIGLLWFAEVPTAVALGGMALIALASLDILFQSRRTA